MHENMPMFTPEEKTVTEREACLEFEGLVPPLFFNVTKEISGEFCPIKPIKKLFQSWGGIAKKGFRIDYVLTPTQALLDSGWELGSIGVEVKSGTFTPYDKRIGKVLSQLFDYQCSSFSMASGPPAFLSMIFLYVKPPHRFGGLPASIMMQEGIGLVKGYPHIENSFKLVHGNGSSSIFEINNNIPVYTRPKFGKKVGSR